jgi:hypothetical protein
VSGPPDATAQLGEPGAHVRLVGGGDGVLELQRHRGQGGAQLVGGLGDEEPFVVDRLLGPGELGVQRDEEAAQLGRPGVDVDGPEVPGVAAADVVGHPVHRPQHGAHAQHDGEQQHGDEQQQRQHRGPVRELVVAGGR